MAGQLSLLTGVLVVEDDHDLRDSLCLLLRMEGFHAVGVEDGRQALQHLQVAPLPSLILLDLGLPGMSGPEFRSRQLACPTLARVPVVVLSARDTVRQREELGGAVGYLTKPVSFEEVLRVARTCCQRWDVGGAPSAA